MNSSPLFRNLTLKGGNVGVFTIWKGQDVYKRSEEAITRVGNQHSVNRSDVLFTTSSAQTLKEVSLWMGEYLKNDSREAKKANGKADDKSDADDKPANEDDAPPIVVVDAGSAEENAAPTTVTESEVIEETTVNESTATTTPPPLPPIIQSSDDVITAEVEAAAKTPTPPPPVPQQ